MSTFSVFSRRIGLICVLLVVTAAARAETLLDQVPSDASLVIRLNRLADTSGKLGALADQFGITLTEPRAKDPLGTIMQATGISAGINKNGDLGLAVIVDQIGPVPPKIVALIPVSDYQAFLGNFPDVKTEGAVSSFQGPMGGPPLFAVQRGSYAAVSDDKDLLSGQAGLKVDGPSAAELTSKDMVLYADMKVLGPKLLDAFEQVRQQYAPILEAGLPGIKAAQSKQLAVVANGFADGIEAFLKSSRGVTLGLGFKPEGINETILVDFDPTSAAGTTVKGMKNTDATLLAGLPESKYIIFGGAMPDTRIAKFFGDITGSLLSQQDANVNPKTISDLYVATMAAVKSSSFGLIIPSGLLGQSSLLQGLIISNGDSKVLMDLREKMFEEFDKVAMPGVKYNQLSDPVNIDGISFKKTQMEFKPNGGSDLQQQQIQQMVTMVYGPDFNFLDGAVDDQHAIRAMSLDAKDVSSAIAAIKASADPMGKNTEVKMVASNLPQNRILAVYLAVDNLVTACDNIGQMMGTKGLAAIKLPPNLPPIGFTLASDQSALRADWFVSSDLIQNLVVAAMQMRMNMMHNGRQGAGVGQGL